MNEQKEVTSGYAQRLSDDKKAFRLEQQKEVTGLMKAAYYDGYTEREKELREENYEIPVGGWSHICKDGEKHTTLERECPHKCGAKYGLAHNTYKGTAKLSEQEREIAELREQAATLERNLGCECTTNKLLNKQLAATQQQAKGLREALESSIDHGCESWDGWLFDVVREALSLPIDTAAIDALEARVNELLIRCEHLNTVAELNLNKWMQTEDQLTAANEVIKVVKYALHEARDWMPDVGFDGVSKTPISLHIASALAKINELEGK